MILTFIAAVSGSCASVPGSDQLWADPKTRYVLVGENHGTNEAPAMFADLVCAASLERKVVVALEHPPQEQPAIEAFLRSSGDAAATATFLQSPMWTSPFKDGRNSLAMLALYERLREWNRAGRIEAVVGFQDFDPAFLPADPNEAVNNGMAQVLKRSAAAHPDALVVGFGGATHMSRANVNEGRVRSAAGRLAQSQLVSVFIEGGAGSAWQCTGVVPASCGPRQIDPFGPHHSRGTRKSSGYLLPGFDFIISTGGELSASQPAVPGPSAERINPL